MADLEARLLALQASEEKYRQMVHHASDAIFAIDPENGRILEANPMALALSGREVAELAALHVWELHPAAEQGAARELFETVRSQGSGALADASFLRHDGSRVDVDITASVIRYGDRSVIQRICRDVSERRRRDAALRHHREFEDLLLSISAQFIALPAAATEEAIGEALVRIGTFAEVDRAYVYVLEGETSSRIYGWGAGSTELYRRGDIPLDDFGWGLDKLRAGETVIWETQERSDATAEDHFCGPDDETRLRSSVCVPMQSDGELIGFCGFDAFREASTWRDDIVKLLRMVGLIFAGAMARKQAQEALELAKLELERKVAERTAELEQKHAELLQTQRNAALGQLVAGVAHEVNTPLGAIKSNTQTITRALERLQSWLHVDVHEPRVDRRVGRTLGVARDLGATTSQAVDQLAAIISSLRSFARLDRSRLDAVDLVQGIDDTLTLLGHELRGRVEVVRKLSPLPPLRCQAAEINQLWMNLLRNASQAIEGCGTITLRGAVEPGGNGAGDAVVVQIADDGRGIASADLSQIFDPGFTTKGGLRVGTGLGLPIARQIVQEHGGSLEIASELGRGTVATVRLPIDGPA